MLKVITAVLLLRAADRGEVSLGMLDLSAAFDTVDHDILINRLQQSSRSRGWLFAGSIPFYVTGRSLSASTGCSRPDRY